MVPGVGAGQIVRTAAAALVVAVACAARAAAEVRAPTALSACALVRTAEVRSVLGTPAAIRHGGSAAECVLYGGQHLPVILLARPSGKQGYRALITAAAAPVKRLRGLGTEAVTYDHFFDEPASVGRGVIVRKSNRVLQLSTSGVGMTPPGLATLRELVALARIAVPRL